MPIAHLPASLLQTPAELPKMPRAADGTMTGAMCLTGALDLYMAAGSIRLQLLALQAMLAEQQAAAK